MKKENTPINSKESENFDFLNKISTNKEFHVPEGYFSNMKDEIEYNTSTDRVIVQAQNRFRTLKIITAVAAVFTLGLFVYKSNQPTEACVTFACLFEEADLSDRELDYLEEESNMELFDDGDEELF